MNLLNIPLINRLIAWFVKLQKMVIHSYHNYPEPKWHLQFNCFVWTAVKPQTCKVYCHLKQGQAANPNICKAEAMKTLVLLHEKKLTINQSLKWFWQLNKIVYNHNCLLIMLMLLKPDISLSYFLPQLSTHTHTHTVLPTAVCLKNLQCDGAVWSLWFSEPSQTWTWLPKKLANVQHRLGIIINCMKWVALSLSYMIILETWNNTLIIFDHIKRKWCPLIWNTWMY